MKHFTWPSFRRYWRSGVVELVRQPTSQSQWERFTQFTIDMVFHGFTSADIWSLDCQMVEFVLPRLEMFQHHPGGCPGGMTEQEWFRVVGKMLRGLELYRRDRCEGKVLTAKQKLKRNKGTKLFFEYFEGLWN